MCQDIPVQRASLLGLPLELRHQIYALCFNYRVPHDARYRRAIASVSRQTRVEAFPILLQERHWCSLEEFILWTAKGDPNLLQHIADVFLIDCVLPLWPEVTKISAANKSKRNIIQDIIRKISLGSVRASARTATERPDAPSALNDDIFSTIQRAFSSVSNLRSAIISLYLVSRDPYQPSLHTAQVVQQERFLQTIGACCPVLLKLEVNSDLFHVSVLGGFQNLQTLSWSGLSLSTPQETLNTLKSLPHLHTMKLLRWSGIHDHQTYSKPADELHNFVSFTPEVLQNLKPLRQFHIEHMTPYPESNFLTTGMLKALATHHMSLRRLRLHTDAFVEGAVVNQILSLISFPNLKRIELHLGLIPERSEAIKLEELIGPDVNFCRIFMQIKEGRGLRNLTYELGCGNP